MIRGVTKIGSTVGTVSYMSPEQAKGTEVNHQSDIWSFGVVLYEMLTGEMPFKGDYDQAIIYSILNEDTRSLSAIRPGVPQKLQNIVNMALAKGKEARYHQVGDMLTELRSVEQSQVKTNVKPHKIVSSKRKRRWLSFKILLSTTVFIGILFLVENFLAPNFLVKDEMGKIHFTEKSIAILPFENLNSNPDTDPFVLGIHRDLLTQLSQIKGMKVISRTSVTQYTKTQKSIPEIASELGVVTVLEGEVQRVNDRVRVNVHLIAAQTDEQILWAASFDRQLTLENIFDIQMELSDKIATSLETEFSPKEQQRLKFRHTSSLEAYELYHIGRFHMDRLKPENLTQAIEYFQQALDIDPEFAAAYAGIADCYLGLEWSGVMPIDEAIRNARIATEKALELDPDIAESRSALAHVYLHEMNGPGAEREWLRAIELNPNYQEPHFFLSFLLLDRGRVDEAEAYANKTVELDPLSPITLWIMGLVHMAKNEQAKAIEYYQRIVKSSPGLWLGYDELAWIYPGLGKFSEAIEEITQASINSPENLRRYHGMRPLLAALHAANGNQTDARQLLEELDRTIERPFFLGVVHATLGEIDQAFDLWLKKTRWSILLSTHFRYSPLLDNARSDPRYPEVLKIINRQWGW